MARLEAEVTANIAPFERALGQATRKAKEFAAQTADVGKDVFKEGAGGGAFKMAGLAGGAAAATAFGVAVVDTVKESLGAFGKMETQILRLKYNLKDPSVARQVHEWIEQIATGPQEVDKLHDAFVSLSESGVGLEKSKSIMQDLQAMALKSGDSVDSLAEAFRRAKAGGLDAGEGAAKLLKALPGLSLEIEKQKRAQASLVEQQVGPWDPARGVYANMANAKAQAKELREMSAADYVKKGLLNTANLEQMLHEMAPRGMVTETRGTLEGTEGRLGIVIDNLKESLGEGLAPAIKALTTDLNENLPAIQDNLKEFGTAIGNAVGFLTSYFKPGGGEAKAQTAISGAEDVMYTGLAKLFTLGGLTGNEAKTKEMIKALDTGDITKALDKANQLQQANNEFLQKVFSSE